MRMLNAGCQTLTFLLLTGFVCCWLVLEFHLDRDKQDTGTLCTVCVAKDKAAWLPGSLAAVDKLINKPINPGPG